MADTNQKPDRKERIYYIVNARVPHTRAYGIQLAKMCEAFIEAGIDLTLVIPNTHAAKRTLREVNDLRVDVPTVIVPGLDWYDRGRAAFFLSSLVFIVASLLYLMREKISGRLAVVYTLDMDTFSFAALPLLGVPCFAEMHSAKSSTLATRFFFRHVAGIIATNTEIKSALVATFGIPEDKIAVEPNGVDLQQFENAPVQEDARTELSLPRTGKIALYVGRFIPWKGLDILAAAASLDPKTQYYVVGGTLEWFQSVAGVSSVPENLQVMGEVQNRDIPTWLAAADVLLILGTKQNQQSYRFTAPMKVYEYMAARRAIVAAATPALKSIITEDEAYFYEPDDAKDLSEKIESVLRGDSAGVIERAYASIATHSWARRAERILEAMHKTAS